MSDPTTAMLETWCGPVIEPEAATARKAREFAAFLAARDDVAATLIEARQGGERSWVVVAFELDVGQEPVVDIGRQEQVALGFPVNDRDWPLALVVRDSFPDNLPHTFLVNEGDPALLCLSEEPWAEAKRRWSPNMLIRTVRHWFNETAKGELHKDDQALEPFVIGSVHQAILPADYAEHCASATSPLYGYNIKNTPIVRFFSERVDESKPAAFTAMHIVLPQQTHGFIRRSPNNVAELSRLFTVDGFDFHAVFAAKIRDWLKDKALRGTRPVIIVSVPTGRTADGAEERTDTRLFMVQSTIRELGVALDIWTAMPDGTEGPNLGASDPKFDGSVISVLLWSTSTNITRERAAQFNGYDGPSGVKMLVIGGGALGSQVVGNLVRMGETITGDVHQAFYDPMGRIDRVWEHSPGAAYPIGRVVRTSYDLASRPTWTDVSTQTTTTWDDTLLRDIRTYGYDPAGRVQFDRVTANNGTMGSAQLVLTYGYDKANNRISIQWPDAYTATYRFDAANRADRVTFGTHQADIAVDSLSRRTSLSRSNGVTTTYAYETDSNLAQINHAWAPSAGQTAAIFGLQRDAAGRITGQSINRPDLEWAPGLDYAQTYGTPSNLNQTTSRNGTALVWDDNGNLDSYGTTDYQWTWGNRLMRVVKPGSTTEYAYDSTDRRTVVIEDGVMTRTLWSGSDEVGEYDLAGLLKRRYIPDGSGAMDARLATVNPDNTIHWHHTDHQGSVIATSNAAGQGTGFTNYSPHGEFGTAANGASLSVPPVGSPFGYTGRQYDPAAGLYQYRARYYSPELGVFLSMDPIGTKDDPNLYLYVGADPVNLADPTGMFACPPICDIQGAFERVAGTEDDPTPVRLVTEWATGRGPERRNFGADSRMAQAMRGSQSMSAVRDRFYEEFDGAPADGVRYQDQVTFDTEYFDPRTNAAEHFLGSYSVEMQVDGNEVAVTIRNRTSMNSFAAGTPIRAINDATGWSIPQAESYERNGEARPGGNIHQTIRWREPLEESD